jgi:putative ABC transport system permease protein
MRSGFNWLVAAVGGIIFAFSALALIAVVLVVASVVAGMVIAGYREFGIAKALGFTPAEVVAIVTGQMVIPAIAGAVVGVPLGARASAFFLGATSTDLKLPVPSPVDPLIDFGVLVGVIVLVALAALLPALQAARTNAIRAITLGSSPRASRRSLLGSVLLRLGATPAVSIGAGEAFARPIRASLTVIALGIGISTLTFAFTFGPTLQRLVDEPASYGAAQDVNVVRNGSLSDQDAVSLINGDSATKAVIASRQLPASVAGRVNAEPLTALRGDAQAFGYKAASGRWFSVPGETVAGALIARDMHLRLGDTVTVSVSGHELNLRLVGLANDQPNAGHGFKVDWRTLVGVLPAETPDLYMVQVRSGTDVTAYTSRLAAKNPQLGVQGVPNKQYAQPFVALINGLIGGLTLVLALIAAAGVFNATLLSTRERVHDIATLKSLGMTPAQIAAMAAASSCFVAVVAAVIGMPIGIWLLNVITGAMGDLYGFVFDTSGSLNPITAVLVIAGAFAVALAGAAMPARWAAATPVAQVLRSE